MKFNVRDNLEDYYEVHLWTGNYWTALKVDGRTTHIETEAEAVEKLAIARKVYLRLALRVVRYSPAIIYATSNQDREEHIDGPQPQVEANAKKRHRLSGGCNG